VIRLDADAGEFRRRLPRCANFRADLRDIMPRLAEADWRGAVDPGWVGVCDRLRSELRHYDAGDPAPAIARIIKAGATDMVITSDVGNNEFWLSRAYALAGASNRVIYSKSFGALGCSLPKAIGAHYATGKGVLCFAGDQGFQMNMQELQLIARERLPVKIVILNNKSSGMIKDGQQRRYGARYVHTTLDSGYAVPDFAAIAKAFNIPYLRAEAAENLFTFSDEACIMTELAIDESAGVWPFLPRGCPCQDFEPKLPEDLFANMDSL
jgi:acetolactate synthase-1/2/3 large subunit